MKIKQIVISLLVLSLLAFIIVACNADTPGETKSPSETQGESTIPSDTSAPIDETTPTGSHEYVPTKEVPLDLPVYPGAVLVNEITGSGQGEWTWLYSTSASGNEIVAYFSQALEEMGFIIDENNTFAIVEEFFVMPTEDVLSVFWLAADEEGTTPDTPNRGYGILIDLEAWDAK